MLFGGINYQYRPRFHTETRRANALIGSLLFLLHLPPERLKVKICNKYESGG
ncbi:hypothetical protein VL20_3186 [Microcystis panniformis FACHB-1757]|uniref:Uncharacterized protein n=1 Tax=Microcystis panniformis FACHB-1757 TaxID=1638788 RepID=A0A0K1S231_9CHRO|nr:hypothetical protein VL20_3186 [Microcystis panniformis FACHB-1757]